MPDESREPIRFDIPGRGEPEWARRVLEQLSRRILIRFRTAEDERVFRGIRPDVEARAGVHLPELDPILQDQGFEVHFHRGVLWIRRLPGEGEMVSSPWPPP